MSNSRPVPGGRALCPARWLILALVAVTAVGCAQEREEPCCPCPQAEPVDEALMLTLSSARAYHHQADLLLQQGEVERAIEALRELLALDLDPRWPEAEEVRLDATARLATLLAGQGDEGEALKLVREAVATARRESFYLSNLYAVEGETLEKRARALKEAGQEEPAKEAARQAMAAFERSIAINKRLQRKLLEGRAP